MDFSKLSFGLVGVACAMAMEVPVLQGGKQSSGGAVIVDATTDATAAAGVGCSRLTP